MNSRPILSLPEDNHHRRSELTTFENSYQAEITAIHRLTALEKLYRLQIINPHEREEFRFQPGQFVMLEIPGIGEAPFSISSPASRKGDLELCIRRAGTVTDFLDKVPCGTQVGLRGPFGTHFPMEQMVDHHILLIAGGLGLAPLRSPIAYVQENRSRFQTVDIVYGTQEPSQLLFTYQYDQWRADDLNLEIVVDRADASWTGRTGVVTTILDDLFAGRDESYFHNTYAIVCGPPVMFKFVCAALTAKDIPMGKMFVSLERRMHCGMGKCCRCNVGSTYTCLSGPVFDYWTVMNLKEAI